MNAIALNTPPAPTAARTGRSSPGLLPAGMRLKRLAAATALAFAVLPGAGLAQGIGPLDVRSRLGERFFAAVPVRTADGIIDPACVRVVPNPNAPAGAEALEGTRIRVGSADTVIIETLGTVMSPVVGLRLEVGCENPVSRDFVVMDRSVAPDQPTVAESPAAPVAASAPVAATPAARPSAAQPTRRAATRSAPAARTPQAAEAPSAAATRMGAAPVAPNATRPAASPAGAPAATAPAASAAPAEAPGASAATQSAQQRVAELRARSDDHAAALLALDDRLALLQKQAELLKAQLEQRLATLPAQQAVSSTASASSAPTAADAAASASPSAAASAASSPAAPSQAAAAAQAPAPSAQAKPSAAVPESGVIATSSSTRSQGVLDLLLDWKVAGGLAALVVGAFALSRRRRPTFKPEPQPEPSTPTRPLGTFEETPVHERTQEVPILAQAQRAADTSEWETTQPRMVDQTAEWVPPPTTDSLPVPRAERTQPSSLPGAAMTREFHITQQFQPSAERVVALSSPEEIVQQARTHYMEDNDVFKAIDLLEMAVSVRKDSARPWQALFAIYRRENMPERFQRLVVAYRSTFGQDENWPAISALGRQIDPNNPLYGDAAAQNAIPPDLVERWLGVPLDFTAHLLANEMHDQLMDTYSGRRRRRSR